MIEKLYVSRKVAETKNSDFIINGRTDAFKSTKNRGIRFKHCNRMWKQLY
jgi:hypothetical protein